MSVRADQVDTRLLQAAVDVVTGSDNPDIQGPVSLDEVEQVSGGFWVPCRLWVDDSAVSRYMQEYACTAVHTTE